MKKIFASLFLISFLVLPVIGLAQMELNEPTQTYDVKHDLSDYSTCCLTLTGRDRNGTDVTVCLGPEGRFPKITPELEEIYGPLTHCRLVDKILTIGDWIFTAILVVAIIMILLAAWGFLTAAGSPDKVTTARNYLIYALIGVAVAFLAKVLVRVVASIMT